MKEGEIKNVLQLFLLSQSMIHQIDNISDKVLFKQEFKRRTNRYQAYLEKYINTLTNSMDINESQYYVELVAKIDSVVESVELEKTI